MDKFIEYITFIQSFIKNTYNYITTYLNSIINNIINLFTNRELAVGFLILIFILWVIISKKTRKNVKNIIKAFFNIHLIIFNTIMILYFLLCILILNKFRFWENYMWKDAIVWFVFTGIVFIVNGITKKDIDYTYFKDLFKNCFKILLLLEFITNMASFSFIVELAILIAIIIITISNFILKNNKQFDIEGARILYSIFNSILILIGFIILYNSIRKTFIERESIDVLKLLKDFALPSILTLMFIPFSYISCLFSLYQQLFIKVGFNKKISNEIRPYLNFKILLTCGFSIVRARTFIRKSNIMTTYISNTRDVKKLITNYKYNIKNITEI